MLILAERIIVHRRYMNVAQSSARQPLDIGGRPRHPPGNAHASLGVLYDLGYAGKGARIEEVLEKGPLYNLSPEVVPGTVVEKINGKEVTAEMPVDRLQEPSRHCTK